MKTKLITLLLVSTSLLLGFNSASARDDFAGIIESKSESDEGIWIVGGRRVYVDERTDLDTSDGELEVGACVEVDIHNGWVTEIERERDGRCD